VYPISLKTKIWFSVLFLLVICFTPDISFAAEPGAMDEVMQTYKTVTASFYKNIQHKAIYLLFGLVGVNLAWGATQLVIEGAVAEKWLKLLFQVCFFPGLYVLFIWKGLDWMNSFIDGATLFGKLGTGKDLDLNPSAIFDMGIDLQNAMMASFSEASGSGDSITGALKNILPALLMAAVCLMIILAFGMMAATVFLTHVEAYILIAVAPFLFAMGGSRWTKDIAIKPWNSMIAVSVKLMMIYLVMSVGVTLAPLWGKMAASWTMSDWSPIWKIAFGAATLAYLTVKIPQMASNALSGTASLSAGDALQIAAIAGASAVAATAATGKMTIGGARALGGAAESAKSAASSLGIGGRANTLEQMGGNKSTMPSSMIPDPNGSAPGGNASSASIGGNNSKEPTKEQLTKLDQIFGKGEHKGALGHTRGALDTLSRSIHNDQATVGGDGIKNRSDE